MGLLLRGGRGREGRGGEGKGWKESGREMEGLLVRGGMGWGKMEREGPPVITVSPALGLVE